MLNLNKQVKIKQLPVGIPKENDFYIEENKIPDLQEGFFLAKSQILSLDPYVRAVMSGRHFYNAPQSGSVMRSRGVAKIIDSRHPYYNKDDLVVMETGMQEYCVSNGDDAYFADTGDAPLSTALGVLGMPGLTSYAALLGPASIKKDDVVLVSAASGAVGSMVSQIAKIKGGKTIGIAGSDEKCSWCLENARFDFCINRKKDNLDEVLSEIAPNGVDIFFDNTGGEIQHTVLTKHIADYSRIIISGLMTQYNVSEAPPGPNLGNIVKMKATIYGFVVYDFEHMREKFINDVKGWYADGLINFKEDITSGIETAPSQFIKLMNGNNFGKTLVDVTN
mgnify:CR=1 FL=1